MSTTKTIYTVVYKWISTDGFASPLRYASFNNWYKAQQFADGCQYLVRIDKQECSCINGDSQSQMACDAHGVSQQLNRSQME